MPSRLIGDWDRLLRTLDPVAFDRRLTRNVKRANQRAGLKLVKRIRTVIVKQKGFTGSGSEGPGKLHPFTVHRRNTAHLDGAARGGSLAARREQRGPFSIRKGRPHKRLIGRRGQFLGSVAHRVAGLSFEVGVRRMLTKGGHDIARIQEYGATVRVTPKMRGWLHAHGLHLKPSTTRIEIPGQRYMERGLKGAERIVFAEWDEAIERTISGKR